ncbi:MAG: DUF1837 domain-containing protein [Phycisphaera sp.]|nr:DUF1837 domain-containing protein [Phycisphaera sp.]
MSDGKGTAPTKTPPPGLSFDAFARLLRAQPDSLDAFFGEIGARSTLPSTQATVHCHYLKIDGNRAPRVGALAERLARELVNYSIPRSDIEAAKAADAGQDTKHAVALYRKANRLFTDLGKTGEGGELLLYLMAETYLQLPQLFCKMPLKTSSQMHVHGADGIHGTYDPGTDTLAVYWGESKLYATASSAIDACFESLAPFVLPDGSSTAPQSRDLQLLSDNLDLASPDLEAAILRYLDPDDPKFNQLNYRGVALVGFDAASYSPGSSPLTEADITAALEKSVKSWHGSASHYIKKNQLTEITIELFCVPFPSVDAFREAFLAELGIK